MPQSHKKAYILLWCCFTAYLAVIFRLTVFRTGFSFAAFGRGGTWNLVPLYDLWVTLRDDGFRVFARLFLGNIGWFVPFGALLAALFPQKRVWEVCLAGFCCSVLIELLQFCFGVGITELDDVLLNTFGVWIGSTGFQQGKKLLLRKK
ncbi:MAG: VanZ family protein [Acutalibacteraceae bacterium]